MSNNTTLYPPSMVNLLAQSKLKKKNKNHLKVVLTLKLPKITGFSAKIQLDIHVNI